MEMVCYGKCSMLYNRTQTHNTSYAEYQHDFIMSGNVYVAGAVVIVLSITIKSSVYGTKGLPI